MTTNISYFLHYGNQMSLKVNIRFAQGNFPSFSDFQKHWWIILNVLGVLKRMFITLLWQASSEAGLSGVPAEAV